MKRKNVIFLLLLFIAISTLFNACIKLLSGYWEYEFANESSYTIQITLNKKYASSEQGLSNEDELSSSIIYLSSHTSRTVYSGDDSIDFTWIASSNSTGYYATSIIHNSSIDIVSDGSKITFKER
jgi:hypothetical protein